MSKKITIVVAAIILACFCQSGWSVENPAVRSPVGSGTVPVSSYRSGLVQSPNPIQNYGNAIVTGNVGGGKHFRGVVPYNAISDFGGTLGSSSLDSFYRRSSGPGAYKNYTGKLAPYYSQTRTVTTTSPYIHGVLTPPAARISDRLGQRFSSNYLPQIKDAPQPLQTKLLKTPFRPLSARPWELQVPLPDETEKDLHDKEETQRKYAEQMAQFRQDLARIEERINEKTGALEQEQDRRDDILQPPDELDSDKDILKPFELKEQQQQETEDEQPDIFERMQQQLEEIQKTIDLVSAAQESDQEDSDEKQTDAQDPNSQDQKSEQEQIEEARRIAIKARAIMGEHKTFASYSQDKFNQYLRAGEEYMKQGKYYRAADAYTMASMYKPDDPLAYAAKSHALFATGEYMSSALFLSRTLAIFPEYAWFKIDIVAMVGDRDKLETRIADMNNWFERSQSPELKFLLGYVYYQIGRLDDAREAIAIAHEQMPETTAVSILKKAIDDSME